MVDNIPVSGSTSTYVLWDKETIFKTAVTPDKHFGIDSEFSAKLTNNISSRRGFKGSIVSGRDVQAYVYGKAESTINMNFDLNDPSFLELVLGQKSLNTYSGTDIPPSFTISNNIVHNVIDRHEIYTGCVIDQATIRAAVGEPVTVSLSINAATMDKDSTLDTNTAVNTNSPFVFTEATIEMPSGSVITNIVEGIDLSISNSMQFLYGTHREAQAYVPGERAYTIKLSTRQIDDTLLEDALGGSTINPSNPTETASLKIVFTRPNNDTLTFNYLLTPISSYSLTERLNEAVGEDIDLVASSLTVDEDIS